MLRVFKASGEEAFSIQFEDFVRMVCVDGQPLKILAVKKHLQLHCGQTRFRQRLLQLDGRMLSDDFVLVGPMDLQLIVCSFKASSRKHAQRLHDAVLCDEITTMERLLQRPQDPSLESETETSALHVACAVGCIEATQLLLEANADKDKQSVVGSTPMLFASERGRCEHVGLLLEARADKDKANDDGTTPLLVAAHFGRLEVVRLLLEASSDKEKSDFDGVTPIILASQKLDQC